MSNQDVQDQRKRASLFEEKLGKDFSIKYNLDAVKGGRNWIAIWKLYPVAGDFGFTPEDALRRLNNSLLILRTYTQSAMDEITKVRPDPNQQTLF